MPQTSIAVGRRTLKFLDLSPEDQKLLQSEVEDIVFHGTIKWESKFLTAWLEVNEIPDHCKLVTVSTVYPTRALWSLLQMQQEAARKLVTHLDEMHSNGTKPEDFELRLLEQALRPTTGL